MKIRVEMEVDLQSGVYDVRFENVSHPGEAIDLAHLNAVVGPVLNNVAERNNKPAHDLKPMTSRKIALN